MRLSVVYGWAVLLKIVFTQAVAPMWRFSLHEKLSENLNVLKVLSNVQTHTGSARRHSAAGR